MKKQEKQKMNYDDLWKSLYNKFSHKELAQKLAIQYINFQRHCLNDSVESECDNNDCQIIKYVRGTFSKRKYEVAKKLKKKALKRLRSKY